MIRSLLAILKAYLVTSLLRNKAIIIGVLQMTLWMILFISPMILFSRPSIPREFTAAYAFIAILVFISYNMASWDWAWSLRQMMIRGILEHYIISGRPVIMVYVGLMPVGLLWVALSLAMVYVIMAILYAPPAIWVHDPLALIVGFACLLIVLCGYSLILGSSMLLSGTSGPVVEILSWVLPIATGGFTPLIMYPEILRIIALTTPFSYPAELIRYGLIGVIPALPTNKLIMIGLPYSLCFLAVALLLLRYSIHKIRRDGVKAIGII